MSGFAARLAAVRARIGAAELVAVSKNHDAAAVEEALRAGQRLFGENRVQEAEGKFPALRARYPDIELHLTGPLQTNKARRAVELFEVVETLDRPALVDALAAATQAAGRAPRLYAQVNTGREPQKAGVAAEGLADLLAHAGARGLAVEGLMCVPPRGVDPRPHFLMLRELAATHGLRRLSMGMSADYETAVACGATEVRVGTALFGARLSSARVNPA